MHTFGQVKVTQISDRKNAIKTTYRNLHKALEVLQQISLYCLLQLRAVEPACQIGHTAEQAIQLFQLWR